MSTKIDWDNISACSGRDSRFPVIKLGLAGKEKGPFRRINLGNEYEDIVAAMRSRAIELLAQGEKNPVSSLESFKVTLKYQDTDGEECIIMSSDEVHDAVAQYEGCSSIKVFATVEYKKPTTSGKEMRVSNKFKALQSETEVEVASVIESREDLTENRSRRGEAEGTESREGVDTSSPRIENRRSKKMPTPVPRMTAMAAKNNIASLQKQSQSPRQPPSPYSDRSSIHAIHSGSKSSPPRTISTKASGRYPKKSQKDSSDKSVSSRSSGRRCSLPRDDSYESNISSKSALFIQKAPAAKVMHVPSENCQNKVKSLRLQKIDGKNKKLIKLDAAPRSFMVTAPKKVTKPSAPPLPTKDVVSRTLDIATNCSSSLPRSSAISSSSAPAENSFAKQEAAVVAATVAAAASTTTAPPRSITPVNVTMPPRRPRQVGAVVVNNKLQAQNNASAVSSISSTTEAPPQRLGKLQQGRCTPTPSEATTAKIRNVPYGTTTTTKSKTKQAKVMLDMNSSGRGSGFSSGGGGGPDKESFLTQHTTEEDGECSSTGSRTSTSSEADTYEGEEETSTGSSGDIAGGGKKAEAFSLNSILAGFYSF